MSPRRLAAALALAAAVPAAAYVLPVPGILRRLGERRASLSLDALEAVGTVSAGGEVGERLAGLAGVRAGGAETTVPARVLLKVPGRCRLELAPPDLAPADRPFVALRGEKVAGRLADVPAAVALVRAVCALLATPTAGDASEAYSAVLSRRGVALGDATLGRFDGRIAFVIGGREKDQRPLLFVDKAVFQPLRLVTAEGKDLVDVRLLGWGSPVGGDWFPRAAEVWVKDAALLRFHTEKAQANPKVADGLFPPPDR